jgi:hypothetical protein
MRHPAGAAPLGRAQTLRFFPAAARKLLALPGWRQHSAVKEAIPGLLAHENEFACPVADRTVVGC